MPFQPAGLAVAVGGMPLMHHGHPTADMGSAAHYVSEYLHEATAKRRCVCAGGWVHCGMACAFLGLGSVMCSKIAGQQG